MNKEVTACPTTEQLESFLNEQLDHDSSESIVLHVDSCGACQATLAQLSTADGLESPRSADVAIEQRDEPELSQFLRELQLSPPAAELPHIDGIELLEELGRGSMAVVYRAREIDTGRVVALKMILAGEFATGRLIRRFQVEAETAANLDHPNIVPIYRVGWVGRLPYFTMKYVEGTSLAQWCDQGPAPPREAARLVKIIAEAVQYAHERGVIHRDLKPANILVAARSQSPLRREAAQVESVDSSTIHRNGDEAFELEPYVTDFGLAKRLRGDGALSTSGAVLGTPDYMSPEQAAGKSELISTATDIYSLGAILFEMLASRPPFRERHGEDTSVEQMLRRVQELPSPSPRAINPTVDGDLDTICRKCMEKETARRYPSASSLAEDLDCYLNGEPIQARPATTAERVWRWARRNRQAAGLIATVGVLLVAIATGGAAAAVRFSRLAKQATESDQTLKSQRDLARAAFGKLTLDLDDDKWNKPGMHVVRENTLHIAVALEPLLSISPDGDRTMLQSLAKVHAGLADLYLKSNRLDEARRHVEQSRKLMTELIALSTEIERPTLEDVLSNFLTLSGYVEENSFKFATAAQYFRQNAELTKQLIGSATSDKVEGLRTRLHGAESHARLCELMPTAIEDLNFALDQESPLRENLLMNRARLMAKRGLVAEAVLTADRMQALDPEDARNLYNAACCYALAAEAALRGELSRESTPDDSVSPRRLQERAIDTLNLAVNQGWYSRSQIAWMAEDADLNSIRGTEGYRLLLKRLGVVTFDQSRP